MKIPVTYLFSAGVNEYSDAESTVDDNDDCLYNVDIDDIYDNDGNIIDININNNNIIYQLLQYLLHYFINFLKM